MARILQTTYTDEMSKPDCLIRDTKTGKIYICQPKLVDKENNRILVTIKYYAKNEEALANKIKSR